MKAMSIIDFLESYSADPVPIIGTDACENCQEFNCDGCEHKRRKNE